MCHLHVLRQDHFSVRFHLLPAPVIWALKNQLAITSRLVFSGVLVKGGNTVHLELGTFSVAGFPSRMWRICWTLP